MRRCIEKYEQSMEVRGIVGRFSFECEKEGKIQVERAIQGSILYNYLLHLKHVNPK